MQKKLIALAVAGLVSAPAFAQSNVTIYGVVDIGLSHVSSSDTKSFKSRTALDSGLQSGSRIGFRGTEDLGNGLKAGFVLENSIGVDTGAGPSMTRQSFLTLSGGFGTVALGRQYTPQFNLLGVVDPFGTGTIGDVTYGRGVYLMGASAAPGTIRLSNLIAYVSPSMGGFNVVAGYTANGLGNESVVATGAQNPDAKIWAINPNYSAGPLFVGLNYHQVKIDALPNYKDKVFDIGATYDLGMVKLHALYGMMDSEFFDSEVKQFMVGASAPIGAAGAVQFSFSQAKEDDARGRKAAIGYTHELSKRTNLYAAYAKISTNDEAEGAFSVLNDSTDYTSGLNLGIRHKF